MIYGDRQLLTCLCHQAVREEIRREMKSLRFPSKKFKIYIRWVVLMAASGWVDNVVKCTILLSIRSHNQPQEQHTCASEIYKKDLYFNYLSASNGMKNLLFFNIWNYGNFPYRLMQQKSTLRFVSWSNHDQVFGPTIIAVGPTKIRFLCLIKTNYKFIFLVNQCFIGLFEN